MRRKFQRDIMKRVALLLALLVFGQCILIASLGCSDSGSADVDGAQSGETAKSDEETVMQGGICGQVLHESDVSTMPDSPYSSGMVVAVTTAEWDVVASRLAFQNPLAHAQFAMSKSVFERSVVGRSAIGPDGYYELFLESGEYVVCVGNLGGPPPDAVAYPLVVNGCLEAIMVSDRCEEFTIAFGIGGMRRL